jgi:glycosyltransferase involved in cell wall biosynthesis
MNSKDFDKPNLTVVIPCFNEAESLPTLLRECKKLVKSNAVQFLIVNNGSTDESSKILSEAGLSKDIQYLNLLENVGYGGGILKGLKEATTDFVGWTHADLQTQLSDIYFAIEILELHKNEAGTLIIKGRRKNRQLWPLLFSNSMSVICSFLLKADLRDINAQPTVISRSMFAEHNYVLTNFSFDLEAYYVAKKNDSKEYRFEVDFLERVWGKSKWDSGLRSRIRFAINVVQSCFTLRKS